MTNERKLAPCGKAIATDAKYFSCAMLASTPVGVAHNLVITRLQGLHHHGRQFWGSGNAASMSAVKGLSGPQALPSCAKLHDHLVLPERAHALN